MGEAGVGGSERRLSSAGWNFDDGGGEVAEGEEVVICACKLRQRDLLMALTQSKTESDCWS